MRGFLPLISGALMWPVLLLILAAIIIGPMVLINIFPLAKVLFQLAAVVMIYSWIKSFLGPGMLTYAISGILIYIFVIVLPEAALGIWLIMNIFGLGIWSMIFWGLPLLRKY